MSKFTLVTTLGNHSIRRDVMRPGFEFIANELANSVRALCGDTVQYTVQTVSSNEQEYTFFMEAWRTNVILVQVTVIKNE